MTPDEQEAESRKYGSGTVRMLRLRSGNIAVFDQDRNLKVILTNTVILHQLQEAVPYVELVRRSFFRHIADERVGRVDLGELDI